MRTAWVVAGLLALSGCSLATNFDRFKLADGGGDGGANTGGDASGNGGKDAGSDGGDAAADGMMPACGPTNPCADPQVCRNGVCEDECNDTIPCMGKLVCRDKVCQDECNDTIPCPKGLSCRLNSCVDLTPSGVVMSSGGGVTSSDNYTIRIYVAGPQPAGAPSSKNFHIQLGPGAGRP